MNFFANMSPLALLVLLVFLFAIAVVVALWSLLTLASSPRSLAFVPARKAKVKKNRLQVEKDKPLRPNRFLKQSLEPEQEDVTSELPAEHVSRSRVRILKTLEPDPDVEIPQFKPTTYDQMVNRQRVPRPSVPRPSVPRAGLAKTESLKLGLPKTGLPRATSLITNDPVTNDPSVSNETASDDTVPGPTIRRVIQPPMPELQMPELQMPEIQSNLNIPPRAQPSPGTRSDAEDTSTQPSLFSPKPKQSQESKGQEPQRLPQPSVQRQASEEAYQQGQRKKEIAPLKPRTQAEKDDAFEQFLRKNDDLGF
jgi:hypothetical protein